MIYSDKQLEKLNNIVMHPDKEYGLISLQFESQVNLDLTTPINTITDLQNL